MPSLKITDTAILRQMKVGTFYTDTAIKRLQLYRWKVSRPSVSKTSLPMSTESK